MLAFVCLMCCHAPCARVVCCEFVFGLCCVSCSCVKLSFASLRQLFFCACFGVVVVCVAFVLSVWSCRAQTAAYRFPALTNDVHGW